LEKEGSKWFIGEMPFLQLFRRERSNVPSDLNLLWVIYQIFITILLALVNKNWLQIFVLLSCFNLVFGFHHLQTPLTRSAPQISETLSCVELLLDIMLAPWWKHEKKNKKTVLISHLTYSLNKDTWVLWRVALVFPS